MKSINFFTIFTWSKEKNDVWHTTDMRINLNSPLEHVRILNEDMHRRTSLYPERGRRWKFYSTVHRANPWSMKIIKIYWKRKILRDILSTDLLFVPIEISNNPVRGNLYLLWSVFLSFWFSIKFSNIYIYIYIHAYVRNLISIPLSMIRLKAILFDWLSVDFEELDEILFLSSHFFYYRFLILAGKYFDRWSIYIDCTLDKMMKTTSSASLFERVSDSYGDGSRKSRISY